MGSEANGPAREEPSIIDRLEDLRRRLERIEARQLASEASAAAPAGSESSATARPRKP